MTAFTVNITPNNGTDTYFRAWTVAIFNTIISGGWVQSSDTGQMNFGTVTPPVGANTFGGYVILKMNDSLQATTPCFLKLEFGNGPSVNYPTVCATIGTGSDGAGNLTGTASSTITNYVPRVSGYAGASTTPYSCKFSIAANRLVMTLWPGPSNNSYSVLLAIERTHDSSGADTSAGIMLFFVGTPSGTGTAAVISYIVQPSATTQVFNFWNATLPQGLISNAWATNIYTYPVRTWGQGESSPSNQLMTYFTQDLTQYNLIPLTMWDGVSRTVFPMGYMYTNTTYGYTSSAVAMRFD